MVEEDVFNIIISHVREVLPELEDHEFTYDDKLVDLGANSIDRAEIVNMSMESLSLQIPRVELFGVKNLGDLVKVLYEKSVAL